MDSGEGTRWEYATLKVTIPGWQAEIADYGLNNWELVAVDSGVAYFKRAISEDMNKFKTVWCSMTPEEIDEKEFNLPTARVTLHD